MDNKINQNQFFDLITGEELSWQTIIYDLIKTEQLDPWDIDLGTLADKYIETIQQLEDSDFFISSKVLLACSLLLRLKSEILINSYIQDLNDALYGRRDEKRYELERIEIDENDLPILTPRTPMARHKKVTLKELMAALNHAINTENRRIKKEIKGRQAQKSALAVMPSGTFVPLKVRIKSIFGIVNNHLKQGNNHMKFSHLAPDKEEKLASFVPILHLSNEGKIFLRQPIHFEEIHMTLKIHDDEQAELEQELELLEQEEQLSQ
ncbi:MAG: segregation/condensation protein A [Nanoarchaeota archaeon]|nr:segregation/condensation protein A [Nanoarchaeota archaeon]